MSLKKQYLKKRSLCKVTFSIPKQIADLINTAHLVGDFNDWNTTASPMKRLKNGTFAATLTLRRNMEISVPLFSRWRALGERPQCRQMREEYLWNGKLCGCRGIGPLIAYKPSSIMCAKK